MAFFHIHTLSRLKVLFALFVASALFGCSGNASDATTGSDATTQIPQVINALGITWVAPSERIDNSPLSLSEIAGYRIYYGTETGVYLDQINIDDPSQVNAQGVRLSSGTYYVVVTAIDTKGLESPNSPEVVVTL